MAHVQLPALCRAHDAAVHPGEEGPATARAQHSRGGATASRGRAGWGGTGCVTLVCRGGAWGRVWVCMWQVRGRGLVALGDGTWGVGGACRCGVVGVGGGWWCRVVVVAGGGW